MKQITSFLKNTNVRIVLLGLSLGIILLVVLGPRMPAEREAQVIISQDDLSHILVMWEKTWNRPPSDEELEGALDRYVLDEMLYQEALRAGLDRENAMVRQSLINQMNLYAEGQAAANQITEEKARAYYELRKSQFSAPAMISFSQLFFKNTGDNALERVARTRQLLETDPSSIERVGERTMLPADFQEFTREQLLNLFDPPFIDSLFTLPPGQWAGPLTSTYGLHLVYIHDYKTSDIQPFEVVKNSIIRELEFQEKEAAKEQFYNEIRSRYQVVYLGDVPVPDGSDER